MMLLWGTQQLAVVAVSVPNYRSLGGIECAGGRVVRHNTILRSATPSNATAAGANVTAPASCKELPAWGKPLGITMGAIASVFINIGQNLQADGIRIIIDCMTIAQQPIVLSQACRALGALAILPANRARIAAANGVRILVGLLGHGRLLSPASESISSRSTSHEFEDIRTNELVQEAALAAAVSTDVNRDSKLQVLQQQIVRTMGMHCESITVVHRQACFSANVMNCERTRRRHFEASFLCQLYGLTGGSLPGC